MKQDILLVEDDRSLNRAVSLKLLREGYEVKTAFTLKQACELCRAEMPAFIICDIGLPDGSGLDFCIELREAGHDIMFLFLTALDTEIDMINGYEAGADDYVTKPFSLAVLISKVNAMMKRNSRGSGGSDSSGSDIIRAGDIILNLRENCVYKDSRRISLTANEYKLLVYFMENPMKILSRNQLLEAIWDIDGSFVDDNTLAVNIRRLREKIEKEPSKPEIIKNVRGLGYIWERKCERQ